MNVEMWLKSARFVEPDERTRDRILHAAEVRSRLPGSLPLYSLAGLFFAVLSISAVYVGAPRTPAPTVAAPAAAASSSSAPVPAAAPTVEAVHARSCREEEELPVEFTLDPLQLEPAVR